ncbi:uncharacterized protein LOC6047178 isoform X3 [Culex quinquefasciatus]|uniref:uncharacterized protein LOC6047178 isoform X3 n=1 Tax=Culex quinquefasciatus TaxID=7176 RepID=UPI0018E3C434|nr:uncharacterized protein LOC6047178 isoform X3 [Culex quinquefasciatus]
MYIEDRKSRSSIRLSSNYLQTVPATKRINLQHRSIRFVQVPAHEMWRPLWNMTDSMRGGSLANSLLVSSLGSSDTPGAVQGK